MNEFMQTKNASGTGYSMFLAVLAVSLIYFSTGCPVSTHNPRHIRESETKSNLHAIQIALERYAVDTGGFYPYMLYGGDITDTFTTGEGSGVLDLDTGTVNTSDFPGDLDMLIAMGYLAQYPSNPFTRDMGKKITTDPANNGFGPLEIEFAKIGIARTNIWMEPQDRSTQYFRRDVGGHNGNLMWDLSEGQRHPPWPIHVVPAPEPHWTGYVNPIESALNDPPDASARDDYQFWLAAGNFYYYAIFEFNGGYSAFQTGKDGLPDPSRPITSARVGYHLASYGDRLNAGTDVYNLWGDYQERSFLTVDNTDVDASLVFAGPDGRRDGVLLVVDSGVYVTTPVYTGSASQLSSGDPEVIIYEPTW